MLASTRRRIILLDRTIKREAWNTVCLVGVNGDAEAKALVSFCRKLKLTVVFDASGMQTPANRIRAAAALSRLRQMEKSYGRVAVVAAKTSDAVRDLGDQTFDGVILLGVPNDRLPAEGALWAARVAHGGMLIGLGHDDVRVRKMLNVAVPNWSAWRYGMWCVPVIRSGEAGDQLSIVDDVDTAPKTDDDLSGASAEAQPAGDLLIGDGDAHDPIDSGPDVDETVHVAAPALGAEGEHEKTISQKAPRKARRKPANEASEPDIAQPVAQKRRGRPPGSKNKATAA